MSGPTLPNGGKSCGTAILIVPRDVISARASALAEWLEPSIVAALIAAMAMTDRSVLRFIKVSFLGKDRVQLSFVDAMGTVYD